MYTPISTSNNSLSDSILCSSLSLTELGLSQPLVFPNPTTEFLTINQNLDISNYKIFTLMGRKVLGANSAIEPINISHLAKGVYILELKTQLGKTITSKIIIN